MVYQHPSFTLASKYSQVATCLKPFHRNITALWIHLQWKLPAAATMMSARHANSFSCPFGVHLWAMVTVASPERKRDKTMIRKALMWHLCNFSLIDVGKTQERWRPRRESMQKLWLALISGTLDVVEFSVGTDGILILHNDNNRNQ